MEHPRDIEDVPEFMRPELEALRALIGTAAALLDQTRGGEPEVVNDAHTRYQAAIKARLAFNERLREVQMHA